jgi:hypothetical protein
MSTSAFDWSAVRQLAGAPLKAEVFSILQRAALSLQTGEIDDPQLLSVVPRLADLLDEHEELNSFRAAFSGLARSVGLWNYIDRSVADSRDELVAEIATVPELSIVLHREQMAALNTLLGGRNLILSAPTSFGKSILIDALLLHDRFKRVAIVLPTIALLDEFRRRLVSRFATKYDVLMHHSETSTRDRVIFLGTQERLINREDLGSLDLVVVDEFYKLDPARKDDRSVTLNAAVYRLLNRGKQFFFLGPNIDSVTLDSGSRWKFEFLKTRFSTVAVDTFDLRGIENKEERLFQEIGNKSNWPALVFASSPDRANALAGSLVTNQVSFGNGSDLANWMRSNYGPTWELSAAVDAGIGVHHGRIPRALASRFVTLFNRQVLPVLICTSTLIEGVNTAAKSVLIYDKTIARKSFDFFTFSNIRGRAGRLGQHHVGQVFLFHNPPGQEDIDVTAPLFGELDDAPDEFIVHIEDRDVTESMSSRIVELSGRLGLTPAELRRFSSISVELIEKIREATLSAISSNADLLWSGYPDYDQIGTLMTIICKARPAREFGCRSDKQLTMYIQQLRGATTMRRFFLWYSSTFKGDVTGIDSVFKFLRASEHSLPEYLALIELFVLQSAPEASYAYLLGGLPRWFRAEELKILEEQGVPIQIAERFHVEGDTTKTLGDRLRNLAARHDPRLSTFERDWVQEALPG